MKLLPSDATLLQAILFGCGSSSITLNSILNTMLSLGFELPTFTEFDGGLARLSAAGLITFENKRVTPTRKTLHLAEQIACPAGSPESFHQGLLEAFADWSDGCEDTRTEYTTGVLTPAAYDKAFA